MRFLAAYIMRGRMQAVLVASVAAMLSMLLPPLSYFSGATIGLVTLRAGNRPGLGVILGAGVAVAVLTLVTMGSPVPALVFAIGLWGPVWVMANRLRRTVRLSDSLLLAGLFGAVLVIAFYAVVGEPATWWHQYLLELFKPALQATGDETKRTAQLIVNLSQVMTGTMAAGLSLTLAGSLLLGRWWQALLYHPGGFRQEFHGLRLGRRLSSGTVVLLIGILLASGTLKLMAIDLLFVAMALHLLQGLATVHGLVGRSKAHIGWLIGLYVLLLLPPTMTQTALTLAVAGFADSWFDFRAFFNKRGGAG